MENRTDSKKSVDALRGVNAGRIVNRALKALGPVGTNVLISLFAGATASALCVAGTSIGMLSAPLSESIPASLLIAMAVGAPIVAYAQSIIAQLRCSRQLLKKLTRELVFERDRANNDSEAKSRFLASMSHELRTPLNAIIGFSEVIADEHFGAFENLRYRGYARDINSSGKHLLAIINDILDLSKIEAGQMALDRPAQVDVRTILLEVTRMSRPIAEKARIRIDSRMAQEGLNVTGSERMIRQILLNLVSNAMKFTPERGQVTLGAEQREDGALIVSVQDNGIGMSPGEIRVALTPFGQVNNDINKSRKGTGLGLPLVQGMMELHDGRIEIESFKGEGTTVSLIFPAARVSQNAEARTA
jgi:signal transduction histidine kinase